MWNALILVLVEMPKSKFWRVSNQTLLLDKKGMKHILERHHPLYWNGTVKATQSFLGKKMTVKDIQDVVGKNM